MKSSTKLLRNLRKRIQIHRWFSVESLGEFELQTCKTCGKTYKKHLYKGLDPAFIQKLVKYRNTGGGKDRSRSKIPVMNFYSTFGGAIDINQVIVQRYQKQRLIWLTIDVKQKYVSSDGSSQSDGDYNTYFLYLYKNERTLNVDNTSNLITTIAIDIKGDWSSFANVGRYSIDWILAKRPNNTEKKKLAKYNYP